MVNPDNLKKLKTNEYYTYKELCSILDIPFTKDNSRKAQIKHLSKYIDLESNGRKYKVTNVIEIPEEILTEGIFTEEAATNCVVRSPSEYNIVFSEDEFSKGDKKDAALTDDEICKNTNTYLNVGDVLTFKYLCERTGIVHKKGTSYNKTLKEIKRFVDIDKVGSSYIIKEIYSTPLLRTGRALRKDAVYTKYIEYIILNLLKCTPLISLTLPKNIWWNILGMTNREYSRYKNNPEARKELLATHHNLTEVDIDSFYERTYPKLNIIFNNALESLQNRRLIFKTDLFMALDKNYEYKIVSGSDEIKEIFSLERKALRHFDYDSIVDVALRSISDRIKFYSYLDKIVKENTDYLNIRRCVGVLGNKKNWIDEAIDIDKKKLQKQIKEMNLRIKHWVNANATTRRDNFLASRDDIFYKMISDSNKTDNATNSEDSIDYKSDSTDYASIYYGYEYDKEIRFREDEYLPAQKTLEKLTINISSENYINEIQDIINHYGQYINLK